MITHWLTFYLDELLCAVTTLHVRELIEQQSLYELPANRGSGEGLLNFRGQTITVMDTARRLNVQSKEPVRYFIVLDTGQGLCGITATGMGDVLELNDDELQPYPLQSDLVLQGLAYRDGQFVVLLDPEHLPLNKKK